MAKKRKIGWQKYEDIIESQVNSPILDTILSKYSEMPKEYADEETTMEYSDEEAAGYEVMEGEEKEES